jgi:hypothetical protein
LKGYTTDDHVFTPTDIVGGASSLNEGLALGSNELTQSVLPKGKGTQAKRRIGIPLVRTDANGQPFVAGYASFHGQYDFPDLATEAERQLIVGLGKSAVGDSVFMTSVVNRQNYY